MTADGDKLRDAAHRLQAIGGKATPCICPQWTYLAVRHIARNVEIECYHDPAVDGTVRVDGDGVDHAGWGRYEDSPWITAMGAQVTAPLVALLDLAAICADSGITPAIVHNALALVDAIAWPADVDTDCAS